jgi:hypothetical protein
MASRLLTDCVIGLQQKVPLIILDYETQNSGTDLNIICSLRSTAEQQLLYARGRTVAPYGFKYEVTQVDGVHKFSKHNPNPLSLLSQAVDFGVFIGGKYMTQSYYYYPLLDLARKYKLISGLDFFNTGQPLQACLDRPGFKDLPHVEIPGPLYVPPKVG